MCRQIIYVSWETRAEFLVPLPLHRHTWELLKYVYIATILNRCDPTDNDIHVSPLFSTHNVCVSLTLTHSCTNSLNSILGWSFLSTQLVIQQTHLKLCSLHCAITWWFVMNWSDFKRWKLVKQKISRIQKYIGNFTPWYALNRLCSKSVENQVFSYYVYGVSKFMVYPIK